MCYQSVCYSASIVDFECQNIVVLINPLIVAALFRSVSLVEFDLKSGKAQKETSTYPNLQWKNIFYSGKVLYMSSSFRLLGVESRDFSQAE